MPAQLLTAPQRPARSAEATERALRQSVSRFRNAFENAPIGMALIALDGRFLRVNAELCRLLGYSEDELLSTSSVALTHADDVEANVARVRELLEGATRRFDIEKRYTRADGSAVWVRHSVSLVRDDHDNPLYFIAQIQDDSERRQTLDDLARSNRELETFASAASHDLQEPLRKITTFAERLESRLDDVLDEPGRAELSRIQEAARRMRELTNALLAYSHVTTAAPRREPVDLSTVLEEVLSDLDLQISEADCLLRVSRLPVVDADPVQMRQLLQNLICNAIKFRASDRTPIVEIGAGATLGGMATVTIADNGIGIDAKYLDKIFEPFQRLHGRGSYPGTGLGLALCRSVVERHGGILTVASTPGEGSTFTVCLPAGQPGRRTRE